MLFDNPRIADWQAALTAYPAVLKQYAQTKPRAKDTLVAEDQWVWNDLATEIRANGHLTLDQLVRLMKWKLTRGQYRPLMKKVESNDPANVIAVSQKALNVLDNDREALKLFSSFDGVGPATASALLAVLCPDKYAFMSDESMAAIKSLGVAYTESHFIKFCKALNEKASELNMMDLDTKWGAQKISIALWTSTIAKSLDFDLQSETVNVPSSKIKTPKVSQASLSAKPAQKPAVVTASPSLKRRKAEDDAEPAERKTSLSPSKAPGKRGKKE